MVLTQYPFDDLSGAELRARLRQRGMDEWLLEDLVGHRDTCSECRWRIANILREVDDEVHGL